MPTSYGRIGQFFHFLLEELDKIRYIVSMKTKKTETLQQFLDRGGKIEKLPAQSAKIDYTLKTKTCYSQGRNRWRLIMLNTVPLKVA